MKTMLRLFTLLLAFVVVSLVTVPAEAESTNTDVIKAALELTFSVIDCDYDIHGNSSGFVIRFSSEDYSYMYIMAQLFGNEDTDKLMGEVAQSNANLCSELRENIASLGIPAPNLTLMLTDTTEKDYVFLIVCNGQVVYDIMAD